jgi:hypothetical protein
MKETLGIMLEILEEFMKTKQLKEFELSWVQTYFR